MVKKATYEELEQKNKKLEKKISILKKEMEALKEQLKLSKIIISAAPQLLVLKDRNSIYQAVNQAFCEFVGKPEKDIIGKSDFDLFPRSEAEMYCRDDRKVMEIGHPQVQDEEASGKDGTRWLQVTKTPVRGKNGKSTGLLCSVVDITERKQSEDNLQALSSSQEALLSAIPDIIMEMDSNKVYTWANQPGMEFFGDDVIGNEAAFYFDGEQDTYYQLQPLFNGDENVIYVESWQRRKDGDKRLLAWWCNVLKDKHGNVTGAISSARDITESKLAEKALRESEERLLSVFRAAPTGIGVVIDRLLKKVNARLCEMTGYSEEELTGQKSRILYPGDEEYDYVGQEKYKQIRDHGTGTVETLWKRKDGNVINVLLSSTPMDLDDLSKGVTFTALDITDRKQAEEALRKEKEFTETALNAQQDTFFLFEPTTGKAIRWNRAFKNITGYTDEEIAGMVQQDFYFGPEDLKRASISIEEVIETGSSMVELELICKDGRKIPTEYKTSAIKDKEGNPKYFISIGRDITEHKRIEEEKRKALEFAAEQSKHALIGQVTGKMAHDFNNVLMGIMGNAQLAVLDCDDEQTKEKLERIIDFSERGRDITNSLMSFSKDQEPKQTYFRIEDKMELVLKMLEKDLAGIKVSRNYKPGIPELLADPGMIQDVLVNLVLNSIHAMSKVENPTLNLKAYSKGDMVYFEIEDNGCGIPKKHQDSIYSPAFTLKGSHDKTGSYKSEIKGTGYGMSNVKKYIVEKHKGDIFLKSEVGKGTRITISLKIIKDHLSSDEKKEVVKSQIYDKRRILLVEDEPAIADVQYQILTKKPFNHIVSTAVNGQMAIDIFDRNEFDVVSLDYMLPGNINGLDVYNHIREKDKNIPVMFISGNIEFLESMKELREKDPNLEHLSKPVDNLSYVNKINELVGRSILITS